jgi:hypothetical protein
MKEILGYFVFFGSIFGGAYALSVLPWVWQQVFILVPTVGVFLGMYLMGALK